MNEEPFSRRTLLGRTITGIAASTGLAAMARSSLVRAEPAKLDSPLVDTHFHLYSSRLYRAAPPARDPEPYDVLAESGGTERFARRVEREFQTAGVTHALCMPSAEISDRDPLGIEPSLKLAASVRGAKLFPIGIAHPERFDRDHLRRVEEVLEQGRVKALKAYLGYLHHGPTSVGYRPYYRLAAKYRIPIIFHTGDTNSPLARLKHAHPLAVDDVAVDFPETTFVLAHFGNPWILDAAQVVYKNPNVWAELSAFLVGDAAAFQAMRDTGVVERTVRRVREAIEFSESPERFVFGSDWPLVPIATYRAFVAELFEKEHHAGVFAENAKRLYRLDAESSV